MPNLTTRKKSKATTKPSYDIQPGMEWVYSGTQHTHIFTYLLSRTHMGTTKTEFKTKVKTELQKPKFI